MVKRSLIIGAAALSMLLSGCHVEFFADKDKHDAEKVQQISQAKLESGLVDAAKQRQNIVLQKVDCEGPLDGVVGATQKCKVVDHEGIHYDVTVKTTSVEGKGINFDYDVVQTSN
ncbi:DUF4333 domain-containing protein [Mycobacteroides abscessus]|uniref:DUF4333 domain-containing protein n=1 Tax=Mycobacteroides abscessus TaxID=36809 RepID=UPI00092C9D4C|nr:DUF4333 domain-containing protein [Mycobacteroides abscessus]SHT27483.1 Uncharacterised protein [Mycobacteroides abscessus subsp. abscessus]SHW70530.1 Uncharacterised protein [Mycobacteroides abscessus subsp. abscessus]SHY73030.1 Uncharacterised protein [Mycobacteroides abscessus subsp. abscessus]SHZ41453.1 Uncharacterised protein [Mycobacteroides abscessus subsp. abscessus]SKR90681.1 Uncharacterised protein [Mycobacteroides abscessus subsp. abscessus]